MKTKRAAVIGGGPGGISAAKELLEAGFDVCLFERTDGLGGQWHGSRGQSGIWPGMRANTNKVLTAFSEMPMDDSVPMFARAEQVRAYHEAYARRFGVTPRVRFGTDVERVARGASGRWLVHWRTGADTDSDEFDGVVVASGRYNRPRLPPIPGLDSFSGTPGLIHSFDFRFRDAFRGRRVVVLGNSISGAEIASELAPDDSITVFAAFRKPRYVLPRVACGIPTDWRLFTRFAAYLPRALPLHTFAAEMRRQVLAVAGHPSQYGAPAPDENILVAKIVVCQSWLSHIGEGRIRPKPSIRSVRGALVTFDDGSEEECDAIIAATGYDLNLDFLDADLRATLRPDGVGIDLYQLTFHPDLAGLAFVGQYHLVGPYAPALELQARWIAAVWSGVRPLPPRDVMLAGIETSRALRQAGADLLMNDACVTLALEAGVAPDLGQRPEITRALLFGPLAPAQFRLDGPGSRPNALELFRKALGTFHGDTSPAATPEELAALTMLATALAKEEPGLGAALAALKVS